MKVSPLPEMLAKQVPQTVCKTAAAQSTAPPARVPALPTAPQKPQKAPLGFLCKIGLWPPKQATGSSELVLMQ